MATNVHSQHVKWIIGATVHAREMTCSYKGVRRSWRNSCRQQENKERL